MAERDAPAPPVPEARSVPLSVVVLAKDEEANLPRCLSAVKFADELVVVDDFSTDGTRRVSEQHGARVVQHALCSFAEQRNWGQDNGGLRNEWVLHLDADEVVTPALAAELAAVVRDAPDDVAGCCLSFKTMLMGRWLRHSSTFPVWILRLVRRDRVRYGVRGHGETYETDGRVEYVREPFLHYNFSHGLEAWLAKHNHYSSIEAERCLEELTDGRVDWAGLLGRDRLRRRRALKNLSMRLPMRPWLKFLYMYGLRLGFLDGRPGLTYCALQAVYEYMICIKVKELRRRRRGLPT